MIEPLRTARLAFGADGTPYSQAYGDVYHSAAGGPGQARHVFLAGNALPDRWRGRRNFTVLETGFGLGLNFLVTWAAWLGDPRRCERLHFVSVEKQPFERHDLEELHARHAEFAPLAAQLHAAWPLLVPGVHRLAFEHGRLVLTLALGDAGRLLRELQLAADAVYLDGFDPRRNPEMWTPELMKRVARACGPGATAATWSAARAVCDALRAAGFEIEKRPGFAGKREMLCARLIRAGRAPSPPPAERRAIVVGAGIAGAAVSERLCARGWRVTLIERQPPIPKGEAGRHAGVFHPVVTPDDSLFARLTRAGFLAALAHWRALDARGHALVHDDCGVLQLARDEREAAAQRKAIAELGLPPDYAQFVTREEASAHAGVPVGAAGLWFATSGWIRPWSLIAAQLAAAGERLTARFGCEVVRLSHGAEGWIAQGHAGEPLAQAPVVVLANAAEADALFPSQAIRIRRVRGQISFVPANRISAPHAVVLRGGFVLPEIRGEVITGASYDFDDDDPTPSAASHAGNLERLARILPGAVDGIDPATLEGLVGFRAVAPDRLPLIGPLADESAAMPKNPRLATLPRCEGLYAAFGYGSRGLLWAGLGAELLASRLECEPWPVEARLAEALDPGRFLLRALRRATSARA